MSFVLFRLEAPQARSKAPLFLSSLVKHFHQWQEAGAVPRQDLEKVPRKKTVHNLSSGMRALVSPDFHFIWASWHSQLCNVFNQMTHVLFKTFLLVCLLFREGNGFPVSTLSYSGATSWAQAFLYYTRILLMTITIMASLKKKTHQC